LNRYGRIDAEVDDKNEKQVVSRRVVHAVSLATCVQERELLGSSLGRNSDYLDHRFLIVSHIPCRKYRHTTLN
jgi:hypothetical protein